MGTIVRSMMETSIGTGAAASLAAAYGTRAVSDLDAAWWLADSPARCGMSCNGEFVLLADASGLGRHTLEGAVA
jgi:L-Ala-D/L-Glu epimerase / N-acetyl-D-glutamate racemase